MLRAGTKVSVKFLFNNVTKKLLMWFFGKTTEHQANDNNAHNIVQGPIEPPFTKVSII